MAKAKLSDIDLKLRIYVEEFFWREGVIPTNEQIQNHFGPAIKEKYLKEKFWANPTVRRSLVASGIDIEKVNASGLEPVQILAANVMLNINDKRSTRKKLQELGITTQKWAGWLREPRFSNYLNERTKALFGNSDWVAYNNVLQKMNEGDFNAARFFMELRGIYNPKLDINVNVEVVVNRVLEIVAKHVGDAETLMAIADEIETIDTGRGTPVALPSGQPQIISNPEVKTAPKRGTLGI